MKKPPLINSTLLVRKLYEAQRRSGDHPGGFDRFKKSFQGFLQTYSATATIFRHAYSVLPVLRRLSRNIAAQLGGTFMGSSLGGSLIHGFGTVKTSDVDFFVYTRDIDKGLAEDISLQIRHHIRDNGYEPCNADPIINLDVVSRRTSASLLSVYTNFLISPLRQQELKSHATGNLLAYYREEGFTKDEILEFLMSDFNYLMANNPRYVVMKYLKNMGRASLGECEAIACMNDKKVRDELIKLARPYINDRIRRFPFPKEIEIALAEY